MAKGKNVLTTGDVAKICNVSPRTVSKWVDEGQLKGYRIAGSLDRRIPVAELIRFMEKNNMPVPLDIALLAIDKIRILIVAKNRDAVAGLVSALTKANYNIRQAQSDFEAGRIFQQFMPHVLLVSFLDENINAGEISKSIRGSEDLQRIKLIAITGELKDSDSAALLSQGFDAYVSNSTDIAEIIGKIREVTTVIV